MDTRQREHDRGHANGAVSRLESQEVPPKASSNGWPAYNREHEKNFELEKKIIVLEQRDEYRKLETKLAVAEVSMELAVAEMSSKLAVAEVSRKLAVAEVSTVIAETKARQPFYFLIYSHLGFATALFIQAVRDALQ